MKKSQLMYVAGLFDGEGSCGFYRYQATKNGKYYHRITANITNTDRRCLDFVKQVVGIGWVGISDKAKRRNKTKYRFAVQNSTGEKFLRMIRPFVKIKGEQIDKVLRGVIV